jgi:hypothetical protein
VLAFNANEFDGIKIALIEVPIMYNNSTEES